MTRRSNTLLGVGLLVAVLGSGVGLGIALERLWLRPGVTAKTEKQRRGRRSRDPDVRTKRLMKKFKAKLNLNDQQEKTVRAAVHRMFTDVRALRKKTRPEAKKIRRAARDKIRAALNADQRSRYEKMLAAYQKRRAQRRAKRRARRRR